MRPARPRPCRPPGYRAPTARPPTTRLRAAATELPAGARVVRVQRRDLLRRLVGEGGGLRRRRDHRVRKRLGLAGARLLAAGRLGERQAALRAVVRGAAEQLAAVRALAADAGLADDDLAAHVVQPVLELMQLGVHAREPCQLCLAQATMRLVLNVARRAMKLVDETAEVTQQHLAGRAQERDPAPELAAARARPRHGVELVGVEARREVGDRHRSGLACRYVRRGPERSRANRRRRLGDMRGGGRIHGGRRLGSARNFVAGAREVRRRLVLRWRLLDARLGRGIGKQGPMALRLSGGGGGRVRGSGLRRRLRLVTLGTCGAPAGQASEQAAHGRVRDSSWARCPERSSIGSLSAAMTRSTDRRAKRFGPRR